MRIVPATLVMMSGLDQSCDVLMDLAPVVSVRGSRAKVLFRLDMSSENSKKMWSKKIRKGRQMPGDDRQCLSTWFAVVLKLVILQVAIMPVAHATSSLPPSGDSSPTPEPSTLRLLASTYESIPEEGGGSPNVSFTTSTDTSVNVNSISSGLVGNSPAPTIAFQSTISQYSGSITETAVTIVQQTEISTLSSENSTVTVQTSYSTKQPHSVDQTATPSTPFTSTSTAASTVNSSSTTPTILTPSTPLLTIGSTSSADTSTSVDTTIISHPIQPSTAGTDSPSPTVSVTPLISPSVTSDVITFTSSARPSEPVSNHVSVSTSSTPNEGPSKVSSTQSVAMTTARIGSGPLLTAQEWIGVGIAVAVALVLLGIAIIFLTWMRSRHHLNKKPIITVSKVEYAQSTTLEKNKEPQWRKSLTMALQSMNTHIEVPKETDEEMQAVDNQAYVEESCDPKTSNQDSLHLTKV